LSVTWRQISGFLMDLSFLHQKKNDHHDVNKTVLKVLLDNPNPIKSIILTDIFITNEGPSWSWSYGSWISNYLCNQYLSPLMLWVRNPLRRGVLDTTLYDKVCQWLPTGWWFSLNTPVSSTNKTDRHDITEILLKVTVNTINLYLNLYQMIHKNVGFFYFLNDLFFFKAVPIV
jgi:hypothetical protein